MHAQQCSIGRRHPVQRPTRCTAVKYRSGAQPSRHTATQSILRMWLGQVQLLTSEVMIIVYSVRTLLITTPTITVPSSTTIHGFGTPKPATTLRFTTRMTPL